MGRQQQARTLWTLGKFVMTALMLAVMLTACMGDDDDEEPTTTAPPPATTAPSASPAASPLPSASPAASPVAAVPGGPPRPAPTFAPGLSFSISDGICRAQIPQDWVEIGNGRGTTVGNDSFILFGGGIANDAAWDTAVELVVNAAPDDATIDQGDRYVLVLRPDDRGFKYRARFDAIYCDFTVSSRASIPEAERADWDRIMGSLAPAG